MEIKSFPRIFLFIAMACLATMFMNAAFSKPNSNLLIALVLILFTNLFLFLFTKELIKKLDLDK